MPSCNRLLHNLMNYGPADYILCFESQAQAEQFGIANGFAVVGKDGKVQTVLATHQYAMDIIGEWIVQTPGVDANGDPYPPTPDGNYWVLFRDLAGLDVPADAAPFIYWASWMTEEIPDPEDPSKTITVPLPRPTGDPLVPNTWWL